VEEQEHEQPNDQGKREREAISAIRGMRQQAGEIAGELGLPDEAKYRLMTRASKPGENAPEAGPAGEETGPAQEDEAQTERPGETR